MSRELTKEQSEFLEGIAKNYEEMLFRYCFKCMNYNSKLLPYVPDIVQEVYLKASIHVEVLMHHKNIPGWLKKSCHFSLLNMLRNIRNGREILYPTIEKLHKLLHPEQITINECDDTVTLEEVIDAAETILSEEDQAIFNSYFLDDLSTIETARQNNMSYDTVRGRISRIRKKIKNYFRL